METEESLHRKMGGFENAIKFKYRAEQSKSLPFDAISNKLRSPTIILD
jgi:hypothetical protein